MKFTDLTLSQLKKGLQAGDFTSVQIVTAFKEAFEKDEASEKPLHGFIEFFDDAIESAKKADSLRADGVGFDEKPLLGLPIAIKDNISIKGKLCTCCSRSLDGYVAPYDATVIERLLDAGAVLMGRTNMDEFAMGSSTEYSCYGPSLNPVDRDRTPGGSSGGSASVVAGFQAPFSLGTETGGSVRQPASYCGIYGLKPSYGLLSRYGVVAFSSSLDQVGLFSREVSDMALVLSVLAGKDKRDETSAQVDFSALKDLSAYSKEEVSKMKFAVVKEFIEAEGLNKDVLDISNAACDWIKSLGAQVDVVSIPIVKASIADYYVLAFAEAASNLSRIDGIRYGSRLDPGKGYDELYVKTRTEGFGAEVKRRIIMGNYVLTKEFSNDMHEKSLNVRYGMEKAVAEVFEKYDFIIAPTAPTPAFKLGEKVDDPIAMYLSDLFTGFVNISRIPALSVPFGNAQSNNLPIGIQFCANRFGEEKILKLVKLWEETKAD
ncbi:MAG: Asp-tRNA(Asn)/Glu-tRNA(Gln) amidotransferase GatCAB subunit A [Treponema sp.]|nr:MAG: Asp-tRNA(Asn)/Glu-tRNA(Gln) amidotransferase GatCAB subunit A [Treponema sp.]